jgi:sugar/nucleoside kinase (ribokinase family)
VMIAVALWSCSGDDEAGEQIIREMRKLSSF